MRHEKFPYQDTTPLDGGDSRVDQARAEVTLLCEVRQGMRPWARVRLNDISQTGFRIAWFPAVDVNRTLWIRIPGMQLLSAKVRWRSQSAIGCEFSDPLHVAVFDHMVRQAAGQLPPAR